MTSRICSTSWSLSWLTRRSAGIFTFSMISAAFFWPMPWMYWSAIRTRLLVGMFTPAIRAKDFSPVAGRCRTGLVYLLSRAGVRKREHDALPLRFFGARHRQKLSDLDAGLIKGL